MSTVTKEWLQQTIAEYEANRDELPFGLDTNSAIELQAFKLALASLEAEPVALRDERSGSGGISKKPGFNDLPHGTPLYAAPQSTVSVPDFKKLARELVENLVDCDGADDSAVKQYLKWTEKTCRDAMLQGADQPQNAPQNIPEKIPARWRQWIIDVVEYLENGLEVDGELEAQGSVDAKRLLAAAPLQEVKTCT
ncbi:hypothetical protein M8Q43_01830 [Enterobacter cloacae]|nr:hypothetical protein [Enterobacter cloacae]MCM7134491.1 hypothetical protein [Enterobacter cloacae]